MDTIQIAKGILSSKRFVAVPRRSVAVVGHYRYSCEKVKVAEFMLSPSGVDCDVESEHDNGSRESELAEATRTSYIEGRWVSEEEEVRVEYSLNDAYLPANGNYAAYSKWGSYLKFSILNSKNIFKVKHECNICCKICHCLH